ncbi:Vacuolar protein sorting-associated protein 52 A [Porphyridium purpureum]|uniref:Vacuolar protein sorting-associated protein 52 A n=1 Tax=Porphyridium purpureum TaxID=35688 RepID=A0A5J4YNV5_PORPP|nr:Vacuolar protein sorting-associated protein 52 A [Porphyridium purpureum]|eukprot:POR5551..scf222_8
MDTVSRELLRFVRDGERMRERGNREKMEAGSAVFLEETELLWSTLALDTKQDDDLFALDLDEMAAALRSERVAHVLRDADALADAELAKLAFELEAELRSIEAGSIERFVEQGAALNALNDSMRACDSGLLQIESQMLQHSHRLAQLIDEMKRLEMETVACSRSAQLKGRSEAHITAFLDEIMLPIELVACIVDGHVGSDKYTSALQLLSKKVAFYELEDTKRSAAYREMRPQLERLLLKAISRVRDHLLLKLAMLKRPNTNIQIIKESVLLKQQYLFEFLQDHSAESFIEVRADYIDTMSVLYAHLFNKYLAGLLELKDELGREGELLVDQGQGWLGSIGQMLQQQHQHRSLFGLGERERALANLAAPAVILAVATSKNQRFLFEEIYRSLCKMLLDTCGSEAVFDVHLFGELPGALFATLFEPIVGIILDALRTHVAASHDPIGLLILLVMNENFSHELKRRKLPELEELFLQGAIALKPKVKELLDGNVKVLQSTSAASLFSNPNDVSPKIVSRRFAEMNASVLRVLSMSSSPRPDDTVRETLRRLRAEYQGLIQRVAALYPKPKLRYAFLINNYDLVLSFMEEAGLRHQDMALTSAREEEGSGSPSSRARTDADAPAGPERRGTTEALAMEEAGLFEDAVAGHAAAYVEQQLSDHFPDVLGLVRLAQKHRDKGSQLEISEAKLRLVLRNFTNNYVLVIEHMRSEIFREFPNLDMGMDVLRRCLAQLLSYHKRVEGIVQAVNPSLKSIMVATTTLVFEIRKLSTLEGV